MPPRFESFEKFWPYYLSQHTRRGTRTLHFLGTTLGLLSLAAFLAGGTPWLVPAGIVEAYGFAWVGHAFIERNRPATFDYFLWSIRGDLRMYARMLLRRPLN